MPLISQSQAYLLILISIPLILYLSLKCYRVFIQMMKTRKPSLKILLKNFKEKIWMTFGLGVTFFGFYFLSIFFGSKLLTKEAALTLLFDAQKEPVYFIYLALFFFALLSISIYFVRMLIVYLYITRNKPERK